MHWKKDQLCLHTGNNASHTVAMSTCASNIINEFLTKKTPKQLDESCLKDIPQETFMTSVNGIQ